MKANRQCCGSVTVPFYGFAISATIIKCKYVTEHSDTETTRKEYKRDMYIKWC